MLLFVRRRAAGQLGTQRFGPNRHIVIFHSGIHYVKLLLDGKGYPMAIGKWVVPLRAQYDNLTILYHPDNRTI